MREFQGAEAIAGRKAGRKRRPKTARASQLFLGEGILDESSSSTGRIRELVADTIAVLHPIIHAYNEIKMTRANQQVLISEEIGTGTVQLGQLLSMFEGEGESERNEADDNDAESMASLKKAISTYIARDKKGKKKKKLPWKELDSFLRLKSPTKCLVVNLVNILIVHDATDTIKLSDLQCGLDKEDGDQANSIMSQASSLVKDIGANVNINESSSIQDLVGQCIMPAFSKHEYCIRAANLLLDVSEGMIGSSSLSPHFARALNCTISGGKEVEATTSNHDFSNKEKRRRAIRTWVQLLLRKPILQSIQDGNLLDPKGGYTRCILALSTTEMYSRCTFLKRGCFEEGETLKSRINEKILKGKCDRIAEEVYTKRTLLFRDQDQIDKLKKLVEWSRA